MRRVDEKRQRLVDALGEERVQMIDSLLIRVRPPSDDPFVARSRKWHAVEETGTGGMGIAALPPPVFQLVDGLSGEEAALLSEYLAAAAEETEEEGQHTRLEVLTNLIAVFAEGRLRGSD